LSHVAGFGRIVQLAQADDISWTASKDVLDAYLRGDDDVDAVVDRLGLRQVSDTGALGALADEVIAENPDVAQKFRDGKEGVISFLVGQLMRKASGAANPKIAQQLLRERLQG
jgi:aspartyl-tRNA(Asn)/glutamyl-tRNA(Gln) amidotransferase subunit B